MDSNTPRMLQFNNLVVDVIRAYGLNLKNHKSLDIFVTLTASGKGLSYKSKVSTNTVTTTDGTAYWDEKCEFQLSECENELLINVCHKGKLGQTEKLGSIPLDLTLLPQVQVAKAFPLMKRGNADKDRGSIVLAFEFSNKIAKSISNFSLNTVAGVPKEKKLDKLKRKMHFGKKKSKYDAQSLASVSLSRRSSFSSITSALAFNSPSPNHMISSGDPGAYGNTSATAGITEDSSYRYGNSLGPRSTETSMTHPQTNTGGYGGVMSSSMRSTTSSNAHAHQTTSPAFLAPKPPSPVPSVTSMRSEIAPQSKNFKAKVQERAKKWLAANKSNRRELGDFDTTSVGNFKIESPEPVGGKSHTLNLSSGQFYGRQGSFNANVHQQTITGAPLSRPTSIASSSGFASLGSTNAVALNETTSPEYLLKVIDHLKKELHQKDNRIRDLEEYVDKLISRIIDSNPELLQVALKK